MTCPMPEVPQGPSGPLLLDRPAPAAARALVEGQGLRFEADFDELAGLFDQDRLVACGARAGHVLKMIAILPGYQGGDALGALVTPLVQSALGAGHDTVFVFTAPGSAASFEALNFRLLADHGEAVLLELGPGLDAWLGPHVSAAPPGPNGAVVVNANPFTLGHLHLVEYAARHVDRLYLFVVREDRSAFPFPVRFRLVQEGTAHLANVTVLETGRYAVSGVTFPSYFLKCLDTAAETQMGIDLELFARRLAPPLRIAHRFAGHEPLDPFTAAYNRMMAEILPAHGIRWTILPRVRQAGAPISASRVRAAFLAADWPALSALVPPPTLEYLRSPQAAPVADRLRAPYKES